MTLSITSRMGLFAAALLTASPMAMAQSPQETLIVAGPRTPESLDQEYPPTEAGHEARRNIFERLLVYASTTDDNGAVVEDFGKIEPALAESWDVSDDKRSITFHLRKGVKSAAGNEMTSDDVMWTFERGWNMKATFHWYMTQILKIESFDAFEKVDDYTVRITLPNPSLLIARLWVNNDLGIIDSIEAKKHVSEDDPWASRFLSTDSASYAPYHVARYAPGQEVIYESNPNYYRGEADLKKIIFREMPTSSNRLAALQAGSIDVAEWLTPREISLAENVPSIKVWKVFGNYTHRLEMNNETEPFDDVRVREALNYLVPRDEIGSSVYMGTARPTKSPVAEIYPGYTEENFEYTNDLEKAKELLAEAGYEDGFSTELGYRTGEPLEEQMAVILRTAFARAGVDVKLTQLPASSLVERYTQGTIPMFFIRDMAIVPDAAYATNLFINSASMVNFSNYKNEEVDKLINSALTSTDMAENETYMKKVQDIVVDEAPWVFLFNPGYQLAVRSNVEGFSWYTPNGNSWYDFSKK